MTERKEPVLTEKFTFAISKDHRKRIDDLPRRFGIAEKLRGALEAILTEAEGARR